MFDKIVNKCKEIDENITLFSFLKIRILFGLLDTFSLR